MPEITIFHNPRCAKSRSACALLDDSDADYEVVRYLDDPPSADQLRDLLGKLDVDASQLVRKDAHFTELGLDASALTTAEAVVALLVEHPRLMERPVVVRGGRAVIARPPELLIGLLARD